ncbi:hypothetical protein G647_03452 [Cladophialophora carrionii CBS 160.54]|uniref:Uncharacterized protein n=1 Tax=Cladophialophora carrionii CBS 160.54 TaxID=1279043 RepID=V9DCP4_9EURO|nr:uncharacterized protein G647_03452 [Cladophialophora carrionii CBS 160.54]ETI24083.1 hypothetical protein G647_03452 [Cladophialophora carrionii CBS 160.54]
MAEPRRSGRQRKANAKYANDGWDKEILRTLRESSESSGSSPAESQTSSEAEDELIPDAGGLATALALDQDEDDASMVSAASAGSSDVDAPPEDDEDMSIASDEGGSSRPARPHPVSAPTTETARSRGIQITRGLAKAAAYPGIFGPGVDDLCDVLRARDTWLRGRDITLPSRETLLIELERSREARETNAERPEGPERPIPASRVWESLRTNQVLGPIDEAELRDTYLVRGKPDHPIVLGPWGKQKKYNLRYLSTIDFGKAWPMKDQQLSTQTQAAQNGESPTDGAYHQGWLLNVGEKVQCLAWAPCPGPIQYLAVSVRCTSRQRRMAHASEGEAEGESERPAFHPSPPYPSSIQIWAFDTAETGSSNGIRSLTMKRQPRLAVVLATRWGNIRRLKWCPLDEEAGKGTGSSDSSTDSVIGLLGIVSSDGHARVVAVPVPADADEPAREQTRAFRIERPGLDIPPPPDTIFTSLTFAGPSDLLLGTASGSIHLYDLSEETHSPDSSPVSYMHQQVHHTYIISLCSASTPPHSTLVASASASGDLVLTDLRSPEQDRVAVPRTCFPTRDLVYVPFTRSFVAALDRSGNGQVERNAATLLACHHVRQFPHMLKVAKLPHRTGAATALAASRCHPCILVGNAKGQVLATNYLRKILPYRRSAVRKAVGAYIQKICEYDWRALTKEEVEEGEVEVRQGGHLSPQPGHNMDERQGETQPGHNSDETTQETSKKQNPDLYHGHDVRPGVSRFHEGFKPEKIEVGNPQPSWKKAAKTKTKTKNGNEGEAEIANGEAVFEEEQAVTAIEWVPNPCCAGIVAVAWGSGLVRVQDLAYDS